MADGPSFHFYVALRGSDQGASFQEVSGVSSQIGTESYDEGDENRFAHAVPA